MNRVTLAGNLTRDVALREVGKGVTVGSFGLAVNERYTTQGGEQREDVCFVDVEVWGKQAEACHRCLAKGTPALIEGRLRCDRWEDKNSGQARSRVLVRADRVHFLGAAPQSERTAGDSRGQGTERWKGGGQSNRQPMAAAPVGR